MLAFTKGKWVYADVSTPYEQNFIIGTLDPNGVFFAHGSARNEADARLSVAAPDMYNFIRTLYELLTNPEDDEEGLSFRFIPEAAKQILEYIDGKED